MKKLFLIFLLLLLPSPAWAADHYIAYNGTATWAQSTNIGTPCSLAIANSNASAGDTCYMLAGTYGTTIAPSNNGSSGNYITYESYQSEQVVISTGTGVNINGKQWIKVDGLTLTASWQWANMTSAQNCIIQDSTMNGSPGAWPGITINYADYCTIKDNTITGTGSHPHDGIMMQYQGTHNLIEGNTIKNVAHSGITLHWGGNCIDISYNIIRDNWVENPYHRPFEVFKCGNATLIEGNTFVDHVSGDWQIAQFYSKEGIIRNNLWLDGPTRGFNLQYSSSPGNVKNNRIYANVMYNNYIGLYSPYCSTPDGKGNVIKNNIFYGNTIDISDGTYTRGTVTNNSLSSTNPQFTDAQNRDFTLQSNSPCIDAATWLTEASGAAAGGSSAALTVDDAYYFFDGWGISGETADTIYVKGDGNPADFSVLISSINYDTNVITLASAQNWEDGADVYHCPGGVCFTGVAPDIGAYEYASGPPPNQVPTIDAITPGATTYTTSPNSPNFTCTASDLDGDTITYSWKENDVEFSTSEDPGATAMSCADLGAGCSDTILLRVTDEHGAYSEQSFVISWQSEDYSGITFWWRGEAADFSGTDGTFDYSVGDNTGTLNETAAINAAAGMMGTNGLDCPTASDYVKFDISSGDIASTSEGRIGFWFDDVTWGNNGSLVGIYIMADGGNNNATLIMADDDGLTFAWTDGGNARTPLADTDCGLDVRVAAQNIDNAAAVDKGSGKVGIPLTGHGYSTGDNLRFEGTTNYDSVYAVDSTSSANEIVITATFVAETFAGGGAETVNRVFFIEFAWKAADNDRWIYVDGSLEASDLTSTIGTFTEDGLCPGEGWVVAVDFHLDNLMVSDDSTHDLYVLAYDTKYPKGKWINKIYGLSPDSTYGDGQDISVAVEFNPICGGVTLTDDTDSTNEATLSCNLDVGGPLVLTGTSALDTALVTHVFTGTVGAGQTEADLTVTTIADNDDTFDADLTIPTGENLDDNSAIVIDTAQSNFDDSDDNLRLSDSSGTKINGTTYTTGNFYITLEGEENLQFRDGPLGDLAPTVATTPSALTGAVYSGLDGTTDEIVFKFTLEAGDRCTNCVMGETALPHGSTVICDTSPAENAVTDYDYPGSDTNIVTLDAAAINIAVIKDWTLGTGGDYDHFTDFDTATYSLSDDTFAMLADVTDNMTADLAGTSGHPIIFDGNYFTLAGTFTNAKAYWTMRETVFDGNATFSGGNQTIERCMFLP